MTDRMRLMGVLLTGLLSLTPLLPGMASASDEELLKLLRLGMYYRFTTITSCKGSVHLVESRPVSESAVEKKDVSEKVLTVAFAGNRLRMSGKAISGGAVNYQGAFDGEKTTEVIEDSIDGGPTARITDGPTGFASGDFSVFVDPRSIGGYPLQSLGPDTDGSMSIVGREVLDGDECIILEVIGDAPGPSGGYVKGRVWVDLDKGCAVPKHFWWSVPASEGAPAPIRQEVVELKKYGDALWGPARYTRVDYKPDGTVEKKVIGTYDPEFKINVPISEDDLKLTLPPGLASMMDE